MERRRRRTVAGRPDRMVQGQPPGAGEREHQRERARRERQLQHMEQRTIERSAPLRQCCDRWNVLMQDNGSKRSALTNLIMADAGGSLLDQRHSTTEAPCGTMLR